MSLLLSSYTGSSGVFNVSDLPNGLHNFRVVARTANAAERAVVGRILTIGEESCLSHLLSDVSVNGGKATIAFSSSGAPVSSFSCSLDNAPLERCKFYIHGTCNILCEYTLASFPGPPLM
jgi:hypothetical protein